MSSIVEQVKFAMAGAQLEYMANLRTNANNERFKVGETYLLEHESDAVARAAIRATLQYVRDSVSEGMIAQGQAIPDEIFVDEAEDVFRAMIDALLKELEEGK